MKSIKQQARTAGILYFLVAITAPLGLLYVPSKLIVSGDAAATAENIRASQGLLRFGIASELTHQVIVIFLVLALYRLFKPVSDALAKQLVILGALVSVPIMFVNVLNYLAALALVGDAPYLTVFSGPQRDALAYLFVQLHGAGIDVTSIFWGLWLLPFGILVMRSGFIPRVLGVLLIVAGTGYLVHSYTVLVVPQYVETVSRVALPLELGEIPIVFWLLIWGAKGLGNAATGKRIGEA